MPAVTISVAGIEAVSVVLLTKLVVLVDPFQRIVEELMKFVPVAVNVNAGPPAVAVLGLIVVRVGAGFGATLMVNV